MKTITLNKQTDDERESWLRLSQQGLAAAYDEDEIEYSLDLIKELNPEYEGFGIESRDPSLRSG